jgi:hypothetical protein
VRRTTFYKLEEERGPCPPLQGDTFDARHGISSREVRAYQKQHGVVGVTAMYDKQRRGAWDRGIAWEMNLRDWLDVWGDKITRRGKGKDKLMMCRHNDTGPYSKENVRLATAHENSTDKHAKYRIKSWSTARYRYWA